METKKKDQKDEKTKKRKKGEKKKEEQGRILGIRCDLQASETYGRTHPLIEMRRRIKKGEELVSLMFSCAYVKLYLTRTNMQIMFCFSS